MEFFRLTVEYPIPCIAAMQGHALDGELAFSRYANVMISAEECYYASSSIKYGVMPGMSATHFGVKRFGEVMAHEMSYSGQNYQGLELKNRGVQLAIVPQDEVISHALEMEDKPKVSLSDVKSSWLNRY